MFADSSPRDSDQELGVELYAALGEEKRLVHRYANPHRNRRNAPRNQPPLLLAELGTYRNGRLAIDRTDDLLRKLQSTRDDPKWHQNGPTFLRYQRRAARK
jgi:hypothetical protein